MTSSSVYYVEPKSRQVFRLLGDVSTGDDRMRLDILQPDVVWLSGPGGHVFASQQLFVTNSHERRNIYKQSAAPRFFPIIQLQDNTDLRLPMHKYERSKSLFFRPEHERRDLAYAKNLRKNSSYPPIINNNSSKQSLQQQQQQSNNIISAPLKSLLKVREASTVEQREMELSVSPPITVSKLETPPNRRTPRGMSKTALLPKLDGKQKRVKFQLSDDGRSNTLLQSESSGDERQRNNTPVTMGPPSAATWMPDINVEVSSAEHNVKFADENNNVNDVNNFPPSYYEAINGMNVDEDDEEEEQSHDGNGVDDDDTCDVDNSGEKSEKTKHLKSLLKTSVLLPRAFKADGGKSQVTQDLMAPPRSKSDLIMRKLKADEQRKLVHPCQGRLMIAALTGHPLDETTNNGDQHFVEQDPKDIVEDDAAELSDEKWLKKQCIVSERIKNACARAFFMVNGNGTEVISLDEVMQGLKILNPDLATNQMSMYYLENICNSIGLSLNGAQQRAGFSMDLRSFTIIGAIAMRITLINEGLKTFLSAKLRYHDIDNVLSKLRALWLVCMDHRTDRVGPEKLQVLLRAACFNPLSQHILTRFKFPNGIDFIDFLAYSPLFLFIHRAIINNPLVF